MKLVSINFENHVVAVKEEDLEEALNTCSDIGIWTSFCHNPYGPAIINFEFGSRYYLNGIHIGETQWEQERHLYLFPDKFNELLHG